MFVKDNVLSFDLSIPFDIKNEKHIAHLNSQLASFKHLFNELVTLDKYLIIATSSIIGLYFSSYLLPVVTIMLLDACLIGYLARARVIAGEKYIEAFKQMKATYHWIVASKSAATYMHNDVQTWLLSMGSLLSKKTLCALEKVCSEPSENTLTQLFTGSFYPRSKEVSSADKKRYSSSYHPLFENNHTQSPLYKMYGEEGLIMAGVRLPSINPRNLIELLQAPF